MAQVVLTGYTPSVMPDERDELIAALQQLTAFTEGLLTLNERLLRAYDTDARPAAEELAAMREGILRWREQLEATRGGNSSRRGNRPLTGHCRSSGALRAARIGALRRCNTASTLPQTRAVLRL